MKNTQKIFVAICMVAFSLGHIFAFDENAVIINDSGGYNALFGIDTSKDIISDIIKGQLGENVGQSVCEKIDKTDIYPEIDIRDENLQIIGDFFYGFDSYSDKQMENLFKIHIDYMEIKRNDNESVCTYIIAIDKSYMNTRMTKDELKRFDDFLLKYKLPIDREYNREYYLDILKFFKHYGKMDAFYDDNALAIKVFKAFLRLEGEVARHIEGGKDYALIAMYRFANGEALEEPPYSKLQFGRFDKRLDNHRATWRDLTHKVTQKNFQNCNYPIFAKLQTI